MRTSTTVTITIRDRLSDRLAAAFDGMSAIKCQNGTQLVGHVADQAQLHGLLAQVRDLGLELESVSVAGPGENAGAVSGGGGERARS